MEPVLTQRGLAEMLQVDDGIVARLVLETDVPHLQLAGEVRFITADVIAWLREREGGVLAPETVPVVPIRRPVSSAAAAPGPAKAGEKPFLSVMLLSALDARSSDPGANGARADLREVLLELGSGLGQTLVRLSGGRLSLDPNEPTTPWELKGRGEAPIQSLTLCWVVQGSSRDRGSDQPQITLSLSAHEVSLALRVPEGIDPPAPSTVRNLKASGAELGYGVEDGSWLAAYRYGITEPAPTLLSLQVLLEADLERLVPLWERIFTQISG